MKIIYGISKKIIIFADVCKSQSYHLSKRRLFLLIRYLFAGGLSFTSNVGLFFVFTTYLGWWYLIASTISFIISVVVSFLAQKYITFRDMSIDGISQQMFQYVLIAIFNVIANAIIVFTLVDLTHLFPVLAQVISAGIIAMWSLFVYKFIIFSNSKAM